MPAYNLHRTRIESETILCPAPKSPKSFVLRLKILCPSSDRPSSENPLSESPKILRPKKPMLLWYAMGYAAYRSYQ